MVRSLVNSNCGSFEEKDVIDICHPFASAVLGLSPSVRLAIFEVR